MWCDSRRGPNYGRRYPEGLWPSVAATRRIIERVGKTNTPSNLDVDSLRAALNDYRWKIVHARSAASKPRKAYSRAARKIAKLAGELNKLLKSSGSGKLDRELWFNLEHDLACSDLLAIERVASTLADQDQTSKTGGINSFAVSRLIPVYENHFRPAGLSRNPYNGAVSGPFIRFVQAVADESKLSISKHTIDAELRKRRRPMGKNALVVR